jgi:hypothetical protein
MTTTEPVAPTTTDIGTVGAEALERGTRLRRVASGSAIVASAVITMAGVLTANWENGDTTAEYLQSLREAPFMSLVSMVLLHYGYLLFVPTAFVLARIARHRAPRLAAVGFVLSVLGAGLSGLLVTDAYDLSIAQNLPADTGVTVSEGAASAGMFAIALPTVFGTVIGMSVLFAAMWRARWISWLPVITVVAGWVVGFGAHTLLRAGTGFALVCIALVAVGVRVLRMSDREFATGEQD